MGMMGGSRFLLGEWLVLVVCWVYSGQSWGFVRSMVVSLGGLLAL